MRSHRRVQKSNGIGANAIVIYGGAIILILGSIAISIIALATRPQVPMMGTLGGGGGETRTIHRRSSTHCAFGSETFVMFLDHNANGVYDEGVDKLLFKQEICETQGITQELSAINDTVVKNTQGMTHELDVINSTIVKSTQDHDVFRAQDSILTEITRRMDEQFTNMVDNMTRVTNNVEFVNNFVGGNTNEISGLKNTMVYLDERVLTLELKDVLKFGRIETLNTQSSAQLRRIIALEGNGDETIALAANVNYTQSQLDLFSNKVNTIEDTSAELSVTATFLKSNLSKVTTCVMENKGSIIGTQQNITELQRRTTSNSAQIETLHGKLLTNNYRIDGLALNTSYLEMSNTLQQNQIDANQIDIERLQYESEETKGNLANLISVVGVKISEFTIVQANQTTSLQRLDVMEDAVHGIIQKDIQDQSQLDLNVADIQTLKSKVASLSTLNQNTFGDLNSTILEALRDTMALENEVSQMNTALTNNIVTSNSNTLNMVEMNSTLHNLKTGHLFVSEQVSSISSNVNQHVLYLTTIQNTLEARGIFINTTLVRHQQRFDALIDTQSNDHLRIAILENQIVAEETHNALQESKIVALEALQSEHTQSLAQLGFNATMIMAEHHELGGRVSALEPTSAKLHIDVAELKIMVHHLNGVTNNTYMDYLVNVTRINEQLDGINQRLTTLENAPTPEPSTTTTAPTPVVQSSGGPCARGYIHKNGDIGSSHGSSVIRSNVGKYTLVFDTPTDNTHYSILLQAEEEHPTNAARDDVQIHVISSTRTTTSFAFHIVRQDTGNGNNIPYEDRAFSYLVWC